jgi:hypothetical protein
MSNGNIFISYRRDETSGHAGRIYDRLKDRFPGRVVMDVTSIDLGEDFVEEIERQLGTSLVFIELIGREWATIADQAGRRRLDHPNDFVRLEVAIALRRGITVIPVLVEGASMPDESSLPKDIAPLTRRNALAITESDFDHDIERLIHKLETVFGGPGGFVPPRSSVFPPRKRHPARVALLIVTGVVALFVVGVIGLFALSIIIGLNADTSGNANVTNSNGDNKTSSTINSPANAEVYVDQITMAKDNDGKPGESTTQFEPGDRTIYCVVELNKAVEGTQVKFVWKSEDGEIKTIGYTTKSFENKVHAHLTRSYWPKGTYSVAVYINGALVKTIEYTIS